MRSFHIALMVLSLCLAYGHAAPLDDENGSDDGADDEMPPPEKHTNRFGKTSKPSKLPLIDLNSK